MHDDSDRVEQIFHIAEMKSQLEELSQGQMIMGTMGDVPLPPDIEEQFLEQVLAYELAEQVQHTELLARDGVMLPPSDELDDDELALKLIEVIHTLGDRRIYLENTNHLNDRELYAYLVEEVLHEQMPDLPASYGMDYHLDMIGSGGDEDIALWMKYYADEDTRTRWVKEYPDMEIPPHVDPPFDRDRNLPKPTPPPNPFDDPVVVEGFQASCRERLVKKLTDDGIIYGAIQDDPPSYAPDLACVWAVETAGCPGIIEWWGISGDVPTVYLPVADHPNPRDFLRTVSGLWQQRADDMERGESLPPSLKDASEDDIQQRARMLRFRADEIKDWADYDEAWGIEFGGTGEEGS